MTSHDRKWKEVKKEEITKLAKEYPFIALATLNELPASIVSILRKRLKGEAKIVVAKTRVIQRAFQESDVDTSKLDNEVKESIAIIFSKKNPFELFSFIKKNKGETTAKVGDVAEGEIVIQSGDTGLPPGPALSTLKAVGLKVQVAGPTISITNDKVVAKKGDEITPEIADVLGKLNMKPMKVGMSVLGVLDKQENEYYFADVLNVDEEELFDKFVTAYQNALNLSVNSGYYNEDSTEIILIKAEREAKAVKEESDLASPNESSKEAQVEDTETKEAPVEDTEAKVEETKEAPVEDTEAKVEEKKEGENN